MATEYSIPQGTAIIHQWITTVSVLLQVTGGVSHNHSSAPGKLQLCQYWMPSVMSSKSISVGTSISRDKFGTLILSSPIELVADQCSE